MSHHIESAKKTASGEPAWRLSADGVLQISSSSFPRSARSADAKGRFAELREAIHRVLCRFRLCSRPGVERRVAAIDVSAISTPFSSEDRFSMSGLRGRRCVWKQNDITGRPAPIL